MAKTFLYLSGKKTVFLHLTIELVHFPVIFLKEIHKQESNMKFQKKQTKTPRILSDLLSLLQTGSQSLKHGFFSRQELAERYHIAPSTAQKILKKLEKGGYLVCRKGCRAKILTPINIYHFREKKRLLLLFPHGVPLDTPGTICQYMLNVLRLRFENQGCLVFPVGYRHDLDGKELFPYDGIITILPLEYYPNLQKILIQSGKPYVGLSVKHSLPNTVFIQMQTGLLSISHYLFNQRIKQLYIPRPHDFSRAERYLWLQLICRLQRELLFLGHKLSVQIIPEKREPVKLDSTVLSFSETERPEPDLPLFKQKMELLPDSVFVSEKGVLSVNLELSALCAKLSELLLRQFTEEQRTYVNLHEWRFTLPYE